MKADFSGYATKAGIKCSDGRTILPDAFKHQDKARVPLVWQHGHTDPENVLGHAILENRDASHPDGAGVYTYAFFNNSVKGQHAKGLVEHKDITMLSIWANQLIERAGNVIHGAIREISLVLSGANPGALIENVTIHHSDGDDITLNDEVIIYTGVELEVEHSSDENASNQSTVVEDVQENNNENDNQGELISHAAGDETVQDVYDSMTPKQKDVLHYMISQALDSANLDVVAQATATETPIDIKDVGVFGDPAVMSEADSMMTNAVKMIDRVNTTDHADAHDKADLMDKAANMLSEAAKKMKEAKPVQQDNLNDETGGDNKNDNVIVHGDTDDKTGDGNDTNTDDKTGDGDASNTDNIASHGDTDNQEGNQMTTTSHNVFEKGENIDKPAVLSHSDIQGIVADAMRNGSLKEAVKDYALAHGITNIDVMFPDAVAVSGEPEIMSRRNEWVAQFLGATTKSPFSRVKTLSADLTLDEARAKGYVKGALKKEEFIGVTRRVTIPSTIYKKQKLDRDDIVDITDFDVVTWLKREMRFMLDEELARAILISDGRDVAHEDKINEGNIRPIAKDHELYTTVVNVNIDDASSSANELIDAIVANRKFYRGTGVPNMYTSETYISMMLMIRDTTGRRIYKSLEEIAVELRVREIVSVDVMEEEPEIVAVIVNPLDYRIGADKGGQVAMFDDFDIDYNQYKYLIETRCSGALTKLKSAIVVKKVAGSAALVVPAAPTFNPVTGALAIVDTVGVVYKHGVTVVNTTGSPYTVPTGTTWVIDATPASGKYFATSNDDQWSFTAN